MCVESYANDHTQRTIDIPAYQVDRARYLKDRAKVYVYSRFPNCIAVDIYLQIKDKRSAPFDKMPRGLLSITEFVWI